MNKTLNIRIVELQTEEKRTFIKYLYFLTHTTRNEHKKAKMKITTNKSGRKLICKKPIALNIDSQLHNTICMNFKRHRFLIRDDFIGKIDLPMSWFPSNYIVREWFPIINQNNGQNRGNVLLDIHIDCRGADPFMAPFAPLNVHNITNETSTQNFYPNAILIQNVPPNCFYTSYQVPIVYNHQFGMNANNHFAQQQQQQQMQQINDRQDDNQQTQNDLNNNDDEPMLQQYVLNPQLQDNFQESELYPQMYQNKNPYSNC